MTPTQQQVFYSPCKVILGMNAAAQAAEEIRQLGGGSVLLVTDPGVVAAGLVEQIQSSLQAAGIDCHVYSDVKPEPPSAVIDGGAERFRSHGSRLVLGVGGGSSLDAAKGIAVLAGNAGGILDYVGAERVPRRGAPLVLMPTTAGTGSEVTRVLVLTDEGRNMKNAVFSRFALADVAIVDPLLTAGMPPVVTADTGMDALTHAVETYVSMQATVFSDALAERAVELIARWLPAACAKGSNLEARYWMSVAATLAGMAFGSGGLGAVHALAYPLGTEYHMTHGRTNAVMLPHVMRFNLPGAVAKYARLAALMGQDTGGLTPLQAAGRAAAAVEELAAAAGVSCRLRDYGVGSGELPRLAEGAMLQARLFVPNPRTPGSADVRRIYEDAY